MFLVFWLQVVDFFGAVPVAEIIGELGDFDYSNWRVIDVGNVEEEEEGT